MFGAVLLAAGVALGAYDRADCDSIYAQRVTGVQPFYALRRLVRTEHISILYDKSISDIRLNKRYEHR